MKSPLIRPLGSEPVHRMAFFSLESMLRNDMADVVHRAFMESGDLSFATLGARLGWTERVTQNALANPASKGPVVMAHMLFAIDGSKFEIGRKPMQGE